MIIHNPILTGSFTVNGTDVASITSSAASITAINSYTASQNILNGTYATTSSNTFKNPQTINSNLIVTGSITAQTLVVQTITSSVVYSSGSNVFGNNIANTQVFTGSMNLTGSLTVVTTGTEFQVNATGVKMGNVIGDAHSITGSVGISGSLTGISATFSSIIYGSNGNLDPTAGTNAGTTLALNGNSVANNYSIGLAAIRNSAYDMFFQTGATNGGGYRWYIGTSEKMTISSAGNVGIGGILPSSYGGGGVGINIGYLILQNTVATQASYANNIFYDGSNWKSVTNTINYAQAVRLQNGYIDFHIASVSTSGQTMSNWDSSDIKMRITSGGNVLIGDTSTTNYRFIISTPDTGTSNWGIGVFNSAGSTLMRVRNDGLFYCGNAASSPYNNTYGNAANTYIGSDGAMGRSTASSQRFKENINEWDGNGLDTILALKPKTFTYKADYYKHPDVVMLGLIAEEVAEVSTYLADFENEDRTGQVENVRYANIVVPLIKAIQELQAQITELKNK